MFLISLFLLFIVVCRGSEGTFVFDSMEGANETINALEQKISRLERTISGLKVRDITGWRRLGLNASSRVFVGGLVFRKKGKEKKKKEKKEEKKRKFSDVFITRFALIVGSY
jgi:hypothetical protein